MGQNPEHQNKTPCFMKLESCTSCAFKPEGEVLGNEVKVFHRLMTEGACECTHGGEIVQLIHHGHGHTGMLRSGAVFHSFREGGLDILAAHAPHSTAAKILCYQ